jgi:uncharacterized Zn-finger protein
MNNELFCFQPARPFECPACGKGYTRKHCLYRHQTTSCGDKKGMPKKYACETCGKRFVAHISLKDHVRNIHEKVKAHKCVCGQDFAYKNVFYQHKRVCPQATPEKKSPSSSSESDN